MFADMLLSRRREGPPQTPGSSIARSGAAFVRCGQAEEGEDGSGERLSSATSCPRWEYGDPCDAPIGAVSAIGCEHARKLRGSARWSRCHNRFESIGLDR